MAANRGQGQRAGLTRERVLQAGVALADREGLSALSMRRLGRELGVEAMTLYHHFAHKEALLDGLVEHVLTEATPSDLDDLSWQQQLRALGGSLRRSLLAHPALVPLLYSRPALTRRNLETTESLLAALTADGFPLPDALATVHAVVDLVLGQLARTGSIGAPEPTEIDPAAHPLLTAALENPPHSADAAFHLALEALLTGLAARHAQHGG